MVRISTAGIDLRAVWVRSTKEMRRVLRESVTELGALKAGITVRVRLVKFDEHSEAILQSKAITVLEATNIGNKLREVLENLMESLANYTRQGS